MVRHRQPNWSPDHSRIAYAAGSGTTFALWILDLRDGSQTEIVPPTAELDRPSWSPDGTQIAYGAEGDLWVKGVEPETEPVRVTDNEGTIEERPVWSPDGNTLYYNRGVPPIPTEHPGHLQDQPCRGLLARNPDHERSGRRLAALPLAGWKNPLLPARADEQHGDNPTRQRQRGPGDPVLASHRREPAASGPRKDRRSSTRRASSEKAISPCAIPAETSRASRQLAGGGTFRRQCRLGDQLLAEVRSEACPDRGQRRHDDHPFLHRPGLRLRRRPTDPDAARIGRTQNRRGALARHDRRPLRRQGHLHAEQRLPGDRRVHLHRDRRHLQGAAGERHDPGRPEIVGGRPGRRRRSRESASRPRDGGSATAWRRSRRRRSGPRSPSASARRRGRRSPSSDRVPGRRSGKNCVKQTSGNKSHPKCTRYVNAGSINVDAKAGQNKVRFQGLLTKTRKLSLGGYRVVVGARDAAGNRASRNGPTFTIVAG